VYYGSAATTEDSLKKHTRNKKKPEGHLSKERKINDRSSMTHRLDQQYKKFHGKSITIRRCHR